MRGAIAGEPYGAPGNASRLSAKFPALSSKKVRISKRKPNDWLFCVGRLVFDCPSAQTSRYCVLNRCSILRNRLRTKQTFEDTPGTVVICAPDHMCIYTYVYIFICTYIHMCIRSYRQNPKFLLYHTAKCLSSDFLCTYCTNFVL